MPRYSSYIALLCALVSLLHAASVQARPKQTRRAQPASTAPDTASTGLDTSVASPANATPDTSSPVAAPEPAAVVEPKPEPEPAVAQPTAATQAAADAKATAAVAETEKVAALRSEFTTLMDDLASTRAKAAVLGKALFKTRIVLRVQNLVGDDPVLASLVLKLDGAPVFRGDGSALHDDEARQVFESFVAPGPHVLSVELEQRARDDAAYGYTLRESYRITTPREKETELTLVLDDDSTLAADFPDDGEGEYDVRTRLRQKTRDHRER